MTKKAGRPKLAGGARRSIEIGLDAELALRLDAHRARTGQSASEILRAGLRLLLAREDALRVVVDGEPAAVDDVQTDDPEALAVTDGPPLMPHEPVQMGLGRWMARVPPQVSDADCVRMMAAMVPDGWVRVCRMQAYTLVLGDDDARVKALGASWAPAEWEKVWRVEGGVAARVLR